MQIIIISEQTKKQIKTLGQLAYITEFNHCKTFGFHITDQKEKQKR